jgi:hypothetical protein
MSISKFTRYHITILRNLFFKNYIGGKHTAKESALKSFQKNDRGNAEKAFKDLVKYNFIIFKKTGYGDHISLNPKMINEIKNIIR